MSMSDARSPEEAAAALTELWSPRVVAAFDDYLVKVAKVQGSFTWHSHEDEDVLFYVLRGSLTIEMEDRTIVLHQGEVFVVPRGVRHHPSAREECLVMLVEKRTTRHTGSVVTDQTRSLGDQLRPL
jgi:mannose-6-phosphate isomerase-like protein (cupin superfamily)